MFDDVVLLGEEPDVVAEREESLEGGPSLRVPAGEHVIVGEPEGAGEERALAGREAVDRIFAMAVAVDESVIGWVGARHDYGAVWELHPLAVAEAHLGRGYGRALVEDVERLVAERGALTLQLGTSDEAGRTTLARVDLYRDPLGNLQSLATTGPHPLGFWQAMGYTVVGVMPDAEGPGKPTILLAKRVGHVG